MLFNLFTSYTGRMQINISPLNTNSTCLNSSTLRMRFLFASPKLAVSTKFTKSQIQSPISWSAERHYTSTSSVRWWEDLEILKWFSWIDQLVFQKVRKMRHPSTCSIACLNKVRSKLIYKWSDRWPSKPGELSGRRLLSKRKISSNSFEDWRFPNPIKKFPPNPWKLK